MPYPNQHAFRLREPSEFKKDSMRTVNIDDGITMIVGRLHGESKMSEQAVRFNKEKYTYEEAKKWIESHGFKPIMSEKAAS